MMTNNAVTLRFLGAAGTVNEIIRWLSNLSSPPQKIFLVHGENGAREAMRVKMENTLSWKVVLPSLSDEYKLFDA